MTIPKVKVLEKGRLSERIKEILEFTDLWSGAKAWARLSASPKKGLHDLDVEGSRRGTKRVKNLISKIFKDELENKQTISVKEVTEKLKRRTGRLLRKDEAVLIHYDKGRDILHVFYAKSDQIKKLREKK